MTCFFFGNASLLHIEECILVELTYGGAVAALYIVGLYFELWLGVYVCALCQAEVAVGLVRNSLLCILADEHFTGKYTFCTVVENVFVELVACAVSYLVVDEGVGLYLLLLVGDCESIHVDLCAFSFE